MITNKYKQFHTFKYSNKKCKIYYKNSDFAPYEIHKPRNVLLKIPVYEFFVMNILGLNHLCKRKY